uniref:Syntaxin putative n=1 Tax=Albugo laibachii Nc14 TaxID=890382 RepID=F0WY85_9STRA|nr:syntaxin putative [Albugo laibachii Nc14]|eukprot:CCA26437.1 syntaxin putative [Albugo laibachii Nc14]
MLDRLAELRKKANVPEETTVDVHHVDISRPKFMEQFFKDVENLQLDLASISVGTLKILELNRQAVTATSSTEEQATSQELGSVIENCNKHAAHAKGLLELLKKDCLEKKRDKNTPDSELRIRDNMSATLTKKFMVCMKEYQKAQQKYKQDMKLKVKRQVQIVKPDATEADIDTVLRSGDGSSIYKSAILQGTADSIKDVYVNVQDKYQDVIKLEQNVAELHQMFLDLALLVEQQGEMLDQIEFQVRTAANYIEQGNMEVQKAIQTQKSARKKKCCLLFVGIVIILIIVLVAAFK